MPSPCPIPEGGRPLPEPPLRTPQREPDRELVSLVAAARAGDSVAWTRLVERFTPMIRRIAGSYRLQTSDVDDVAQAVWLRLFRSVAQVREPSALWGWLETTTRRESLRLLQRPLREHLTSDPGLGDRVEHDGPESLLIAEDRRALLSRAMATLPDRHRRIMTLLACQATPNYRHISTTLGIPIGSIGPIRARSLTRLQRHPELRGLQHELS